jgi:hypothetical protein
MLILVIVRVGRTARARQVPPAQSCSPAETLPEDKQDVAVGLTVSAGGALTPVMAAILHNVSSVAVVGNSSRLTRYRIRRSGPTVIS